MNVDDPGRVWAIARALRDIAADRPVIFPMHPRTKAKLDTAGVAAKARGLMAPVLGAAKTEALIERVMKLDDLKSVRDLIPLLAG